MQRDKINDLEIFRIIPVSYAAIVYPMSYVQCNKWNNHRELHPNLKFVLFWNWIARVPIQLHN
jgi:hypothetical protein